MNWPLKLIWSKETNKRQKLWFYPHIYKCAWQSVCTLLVTKLPVLYDENQSSNWNLKRKWKHKLEMNDFFPYENICLCECVWLYVSEWVSIENNTKNNWTRQNGRNVINKDDTIHKLLGAHVVQFDRNPFLIVVLYSFKLYGIFVYSACVSYTIVFVLVFVFVRACVSFMCACTCLCTYV